MLRPLTLSASTTMVSSLDPAIDHEASDLKAYGENGLFKPGCWKDYLKFKAGEKPTIFVIGVIPPDDLAMINDETSSKYESEALRWRAFLLSLRDIEGWDGEEIPKRKVSNVEYVDQQWIKRNFIRGLRPIALEVGLVAYLWNQLTETEIKN